MDGGQSRDAAREYRALHDGLAPLSVRDVELGRPYPIAARLGPAPEARYHKRRVLRGRPSVDLFRHFHLEHEQKRLGLAAVLGQLPVWAVDTRGQLHLLDQRFITVTSAGIEDRPHAGRKPALADGRPLPPRRLVSLGPLPEIRWVNDRGRVERRVFFAALQEESPGAADALLPLLVHDERGDLFVIRQEHIRVHPDGTVEESEKPMSKVPLANPSAMKSKQHHAATRKAKGVETHRSKSEEMSASESAGSGWDTTKAFLAGVGGVLASAWLLRDTSLSTSWRAGVTAVSLGVGGALLQDRFPNAGKGIMFAGAGAAAIPLFDSARTSVFQAESAPAQGAQQSPAQVGAGGQQTTQTTTQTTTTTTP
jgi:hypothetical protein